MADHILETGRPMPTIAQPGNDAMSIAVSWTHAGSVPGRARAGPASDSVRERKKGRAPLRMARSCPGTLAHARSDLGEQGQMQVVIPILRS
jgi:hypothetical protein